MAIGSFCLVLHGHMPYVLRHGLWPHGEDWLYEAAAETYLPLLATIDECRYLNCNPKLTVGLTPILLEQLAHEDFKSGFEKYLSDRLDRARADAAEFTCSGQAHLAYLAQRWQMFFSRLAEQFEQINRDIPRAFVERMNGGLIELLTSSATHAYLPLLLEDSSVRAQIRAGLSSSENILGFRPRGIWIPEGAYRPGGAWKAPIQWSPKAHRISIGQVIADEGLTHFFVESSLIENSQKVCWEHYRNFESRNGQCVCEPVGVNVQCNDTARPAAFARDADICKQVWCGFVGYPADGVYLEFHKRHGQRRGLRYWKVTDTHLGLGDKQMYYPDDIAGRIYEHSRHFCHQIKKRLNEYYRQTGKHGVIVACFDAELFGHWWFEGPRFLRDVLLTLNADTEVELCTPAAYLDKHPPDKLVSLSEGSWGEGGDHRVWANDKINWMWQVEYRCEALFGKLTYHLPWRKHHTLRQILEKAGRELLLLQASDWPFVITRGQAVDYAIKRFMGHVARFETLTDTAEKLAADLKYLGKLSDVQKFELQDSDIHDVVFPNIDLNWWNM
jgi:1,4-alpha-glucan branching enzyme